MVALQGGVSEEAALGAIERGAAFLRGRRVRDPRAPVAIGDKVAVSLQAPPELKLERARLLHLDALVVAVDKPAGVPAQEDLAGSTALPSLCSALLREMGEKQTRALLVHRLDKGTTGVCVLARTKKAQAALLEEFREHRARKEYRALVAGAPASEEGVVDSPIDGQPALTRFRVLERYPQAALVAALPETGRTHQIRIHLRGLGLPLLGDTRYGGPAFLTRPTGARHDFGRPMLHALSLEVRHPDGTQLRLKARSPGDFEAARAFLG